MWIRCQTSLVAKNNARLHHTDAKPPCSCLPTISEILVTIQPSKLVCGRCLKSPDPMEMPSNIMTAEQSSVLHMACTTSCFRSVATDLSEVNNQASLVMMSAITAARVMPVTTPSLSSSLVRRLTRPESVLSLATSDCAAMERGSGTTACTQNCDQNCSTVIPLA